MPYAMSFLMGILTLNVNFMSQVLYFSHTTTARGCVGP